jgi:hypothetical protein
VTLRRVKSLIPASSNAGDSLNLPDANCKSCVPVHRP